VVSSLRSLPSGQPRQPPLNVTPPIPPFQSSPNWPGARPGQHLLKFGERGARAAEKTGKITETVHVSPNVFMSQDAFSCSLPKSAYSNYAARHANCVRRLRDAAGGAVPSVAPMIGSMGGRPRLETLIKESRPVALFINSVTAFLDMRTSKRR